MCAIVEFATTAYAQTSPYDISLANDNERGMLRIDMCVLAVE